MNEVEDPIAKLEERARKDYPEFFEDEELVDFLDDAGTIFLVFLDWRGFSRSETADDIMNEFENVSIQEHSSLEAWANYMCDALGMADFLSESPYERYWDFDWKTYVADSRCSFTFYETEDGVYVISEF